MPRTKVTIGRRVSYLDSQAFDSCSSLTSIFFRGNRASTGAGVFLNDNKATVYFLPGTAGWGSSFAGRPAILWNPRFETVNANFGVRSNHFGIKITGTADIPILLEACTNLANPAWQPLQTATLTNGSFYFSDPGWTNHPLRLYRIRSP